MVAAWLTRGGSAGEREQEALTSGLVIAGWTELGDITDAASREDIRTLLERAYDGESARVIGNWTGQLWRFVKEISIGDLVVMPLHTQPGRLAIGRVTGEYRYRPEKPADFRHVRDVQWLHKSLPRDTLKPDLRASTGSLLTVCGLTRRNAAQRIAHLAEHGTDPGLDGEEEVTHWQKLLEDAIESSASEPRRLSIRALLGHWGWERRTAEAIELIKRDLSETGMTTRPPFTEGSLDAEIELIPVNVEPGSGVEESDENTEDVNTLTSVTPHIGTLPPATLVSVPSTAALQQAVTKMVVNNFSQLGVIDEDGKYHGAVSWESIGRARVAYKSPTLANATILPTVVDSNSLLLDLIDTIYAEQFVFVRAQDQVHVTGIVTASDLTRQFGDHVRPFVLVEEIESRLRRSCKSAGFTEEDYQNASRNKKIISAEMMSFGGYAYLLGPSERWEKLGWDVEQQELLDLLGAVREVRNNLMHFSADKIEEKDYAKIRGLLNLLQTVDPHP